jgi:tetratricopeptide (TPR) repeat protein
MGLDPANFPEEEQRLLELAKAHQAAFDDGQEGSLISLIQDFSNVGNLYQLAGRLDDAENAYNQALEFKSSRATEMDDAGTIFVISSIQTEIGVIYRKRNQYEEAVQCFETALEIRRQLAVSDPGTYDPRVGESLNSLATALRKLGKLDDAKRAFREALELRMRLAEDGSPERLQDLAITHSSMGALAVEAGLQEEARASFEAALEALNRIPEDQAAPYLSTLGNVLNNLGVVQNDLQDYAGALESYQQALNVYERSGDTLPASAIPEVAMIYNNIGSVYKSLRETESAEQAFVKSYDLYKGLVESEPHVYSRYLSVAMENLRLFYSQAGKQESGLQLVKDTLDFIQQVSGIVDEKIQALQGKIDEHIDNVHVEPLPPKQQPKRAPKKIGRNDPCPCGSGKKYKKCCMLKDQGSGA